MSKKEKGSRIATTLKAILDIVLALIIGAGILSVIAMIVSIVNPSSVPAELVTVYKLSPEKMSNLFEPVMTDKAVKNHNVQFFARVKYFIDGKLISALFWSAIYFYLAVSIVIIMMLRKFLGNYSEGRMLTIENARYIRIIGIAIITIEIVELIFLILNAMYIKSAVTVPGAVISLRYTLSEVNPGSILFGLVVIVISEVLRQGALIREEHELTI